MDQLARQPKLLKDYAPPDYLIETVELDFDLDPKATRVKSKLRLRPNPKAAPGDRPLVLDGEGLVLQSLALDGKPLGLDDYRLGEKALTIPKVPARPFTLETVTLCDPRPTRRCRASTARATPIAPSASRKAFAVSPISSTGLTRSPSIR